MASHAFPCVDMHGANPSFDAIMCCAVHSADILVPPLQAVLLQGWLQQAWVAPPWVQEVCQTCLPY